jgi:hypothetical protein
MHIQLEADTPLQAVTPLTAATPLQRQRHKTEKKQTANRFDVSISWFQD